MAGLATYTPCLTHSSTTTIITSILNLYLLFFPLPFTVFVVIGLCSVDWLLNTESTTVTNGYLGHCNKVFGIQHIFTLN